MESMSSHNKATRWKIKRARQLRKHQTTSELAMWPILKRLEAEFGIHFWRQSVLLGWIADFWCPALRLVIEVDGPSHDTRGAYDENRAKVMQEELGATTLRFTNQAVKTNPLTVESTLRAWIKRRLSDGSK